jgi:hypothetical protein
MVDRYTKVVLTVIALSLLWLCAMMGASAVQARGSFQEPVAVPAGVQPVVVVGWGSIDSEGKVALRYVTENGARVTDAALPIRAERPLAVELPYTPANPLPATTTNSTANPVPVQISSIGKSSGEWAPIRARVEEAPVRRTPGGESK